MPTVNANFDRYERIRSQFMRKNFAHTVAFSQLDYDEVIVHLALTDGFELVTSHSDGNDDGVIRLYRHRATKLWVMIDRWYPSSTWVLLGTKARPEDLAWATAVVSGLGQVGNSNDIGPGLSLDGGAPWDDFGF